MTLPCSAKQLAKLKAGLYPAAALLMLLFLAACQTTSAHPAVSATPATPSVTPTGTNSPAPPPTLIPASATPDLSAIRYEQSGLALAAQSAVLIDAQSGEALLEKDPHRLLYPASTTKIMTALLALEYFEPDEMLWVGDEVNLAWTRFRLDAQKAGLLYGQEISMRELLYGLMLASGSDAAFVIAANVARRERQDDWLPVDQAIVRFCELMNQRAREIGALDTNFTSPDGFQDSNHFSSAYDLAVIAREAMQNPLFREIVRSETYQPAEHDAQNGVFSVFWRNTNRLLDPADADYYAAANGIKTGTTTEAGYCLVSSAEFDGQTYIAVALNSTQEGVWSDSVALLEYARENLPVN